jgi:hypothetical protein
MAYESLGLDFLLNFIVPGLVGLKWWALKHPNHRKTVNEQLVSAFIFGAVCFSITSMFPGHINIPLLIEDNSEKVAWQVPLSDSPSIFGMFVVPVVLAILGKRTYAKMFPAKHPTPVAWEFVFGEYLVGRLPIFLKITLTDGQVVAGAATDDATFSDLPDNYQIFLDYECELDENGEVGEVKKGSEGVLLMGHNISHIEFIKARGEDDE